MRCIDHLLTKRGGRARYLLIVSLCFFVHVDSFATSYTWTGLGSDNNWNTTANWSPSTGFPQFTSDNATFDGTGVKNCSINVPVSINSINVNAGYSGTITQLAGNSMTFAGASAFNAGTFAGGNSNILFSSTFSVGAGCTAFTSTSASLKIQGNFTYNGPAFSNHSGTVSFYQPVVYPQVIRANTNFANNIWDLKFEGSSGSQYYIPASGSPSSALTVNGNLTIDAQDASRLWLGYTSSPTYPGPSQSITVKGTTTTSGTTSGGFIWIDNTINAEGDISINNKGIGGGGTGALVINGPGVQNLTSTVSAHEGSLPSVTINKSGSLNLTGTISEIGNWTYVSGTVAPGSSTVVIEQGAWTIDAVGPSSTMSFNNLTIDNVGFENAALGSNVDVNGNLTIMAGSRLYGSSYNLTVGGNWDSSGSNARFMSDTGTVTFDGTNQSVSMQSNSNSFYNLTMQQQPSGQLTVNNSPISVTHALAMNAGIINSTTTNYINIANDAVATGGSNISYVDGVMKKTGDDAFTFPLGDNGLYRPLFMTAPSGFSDSFTAQYFNSNSIALTQRESTIATLSSFESWEFLRTAGSSTVKVKIAWDTADYSGGPYITDPTTLFVAYWNGSQWIDDLGNGGTSSTGPTSGTLLSNSSMTSFGTITFGSTSYSNPLPITITFFKGNYSDAEAAVELLWGTSSEIDNGFFILEKSGDGRKFEFVGEINSMQGVEKTNRQYQFTDTNPFKKISYYRLTQIDFDGTKKHAGFTAVEVPVNDHLNYIFPNPGNGEFVNFLVFDTFEKQDFLYLFVYDSRGGLIVRDLLPPEELEGLKIRYNFKEQLSSGAYFIRLVSKANSSHFKYFVSDH